MNTSPNYKPHLSLLTTLFFIWGFITVLNDILIPHLKALFEMNYAQTMLIQTTFFGAYAIMSIPSGWFVTKTSYKTGIITGLIITGLGAFLFYPASIIVSYPFFLIALFVLASGITVLQVAANPAVTLLGKPENASGRLNMTQAFNSLGTTIAPIFGGILILTTQTATIIEKAEKVQIPYMGIGLFLLLIAVIFLFVKMPLALNTKSEESTGVKTDKISAWQYRHLVLGAIAIFVYVGAEVSIGSFMINFFSEDFVAGLAEKDAAKYVALYWGGAMIGRFFGASYLSGLKGREKVAILFTLITLFAFLVAWYLTKEINLALVFLGFVGLNMIAFLLGKKSPNRVLALFAGVIIVLVAVTILFSGEMVMWTLLSVGLFNSIMFPTIFALAVNGLGKHTSQASGILCTSIVGGAVIPLLMGFLADAIGINNAFVITIFCYGYIMYYGISGYKTGRG